MNQQNRAVTPVVSTILMVAIVIILAATVSVFFFYVADDINEPAPNVADTTGEFTVTPPGERAGNKQIVRITHIAGEGVPLDEMEIIVRASGNNMDDTQVRLVNLPPSDTTFDDESYEGNEDLVSGRGVTDGVLFDDSSTWTAGQSIIFRIPVTDGADFREDPNGPDADELEVIIVHTPSNAIISENTFRP
ncbi:type IV pilin [Halorubrum tebenquichense]|uniref:Archaeal Type IV pilin N-terminal domain-containing protein n=1 Tax=Halorubrum tebenquichense DSM 14210 TaxID=1227485 RepID=M0DGD5_9EURY|nr:type IV pilin N-terminal domain-containing protein [Halorubrum tebenquichense]ELZ33239.1 hypothetical protein C472_15062 [Halorubrum tebenquichense DSM 14210]